MKNTRKCPKCGGTDIRMIEGFVGSYGVGNSIMVGLTTFSAVRKNTYICCDCCYTEEWLNKDDLERVRSSKKAHRI